MTLDFTVYALGALCIALLCFIVGCLLHDSFERNASRAAGKSMRNDGDEDLATP
ncbi:MAG: hypothetical protein V4636_13480 [Pseudomonadota bacterium]